MPEGQVLVSLTEHPTIVNVTEESVSVLVDASHLSKVSSTLILKRYLSIILAVMLWGLKLSIIIIEILIIRCSHVRIFGL